MRQALPSLPNVARHPGILAAALGLPRYPSIAPPAWITHLLAGGFQPRWGKTELWSMPPVLSERVIP